MGCYVLDSYGSEYEPCYGSCEYGYEPSGSLILGKFLSGWATGGFSNGVKL
jgi:hypothetical protein